MVNINDIKSKDDMTQAKPQQNLVENTSVTNTLKHSNLVTSLTEIIVKGKSN